MRIKTKLHLLLVMFALTVMAWGKPAPALAVCSGDDCGCGYETQECIAECPPIGDPGRQPCINACVLENKACAKACCGG